MATISSNTELRETQFLKAQLADEAGRHDHTVRFMTEIAISVTPLTELSLPERKFLRSAIKKVLDDHRQAWYQVNSKTFKEVGVKSSFAKFYLNRIAGEILSVCKKMIRLINRWLIRSARSAESRVFYLTFKGDVSCYITEFLAKKGEEDDSAILAYREAKAIAKAELTWLSPARLMLALSMSEFYAEILEFPGKGISVARKALKNAMEAGGNLTEGEVLDKEIKEALSKLWEYHTILTDNEDEEEEEEEEAGTSLVQEAFPFEIAENVGTSGAAQPFPLPKPASDKSETSMIRASLPCEEPRISETPVTPPAESGLKTGVSETPPPPPPPAL